MDATRSAPFDSFDDFYRQYLAEHSQPTCRRLHFFGCLGALFCVAKLLATLNPWWLVATVAWGYGMCWAGHYGFEKNRPRVLRHPVYSFAGNWAMFRDILFGRIPF